MTPKDFHIVYTHSSGEGARTVRAVDEAGAIEKARARATRSGLHHELRDFRAVSKAVALRIVNSPAYTIIPATDPICKEIQNGYDNYSNGIILADSKFTDLDGEWLVGPVPTVPEGYGWRSQGHLYANVHVGIKRHEGPDGYQIAYGIRFWTDRCSDRGYMTYSHSGLAQDRVSTKSRAYIHEHYTNVQEVDGVITCKDDRGNDCVLNELDTLNGWFVKAVTA